MANFFKSLGNFFGSQGFNVLSSATGGVLSSLLQSSNQKKLLNAQLAENQKNRDFNASQAQLQRDFALDMFNRTNAYNDPSAQVQRMRSAGINPALAFGGMSDGSLASMASGTSASSSGSVSSSPLDYSGIVHAFDSPLQAAQTDLLRAQAAKTRAETPWIDELNSITKDNMLLEGLSLKFDLENTKPAEVANIRATLENIQETSNQIRANTRLLEIAQDNAELEKEARKIDLKTLDERNLATIKQSLSSANLSDKQAAEVAYLMGAKLSLLTAQARASNSTAALNEFQSSINEAMKCIAGIEGLADYQIKEIKSNIFNLQQQGKAARSNAKTNAQNSETLSRSVDTAETGVWLNFASSCINVAATAAFK